MVAGTVCSTPSAIFFMVPRRIFPERVLGSRLTTIAVLNAATGPMLSRTSSTSSRTSSSSLRVHAGLGHDEPDRHLALERVGHADDRALGDVRVRGEHLFHGAGREPVAGHVDDVVHAAHDVEVAVLVLVAGVAREVVAGMPREVRLLVALVVVPERGQAAGRQRQLDRDAADLARRAARGCPRRGRARRSRARPWSASPA